MVEPQGTHLQNARPRGGWPNTADPEVKPGRKIRKARERLARRIESFDNTMRGQRSQGAYHRPGSLKCK